MLVGLAPPLLDLGQRYLELVPDHRPQGEQTLLQEIGPGLQRGGLRLRKDEYRVGDRGPSIRPVLGVQLGDGAAKRVSDLQEFGELRRRGLEVWVVPEGI